MCGDANLIITDKSFYFKGRFAENIEIQAAVYVLIYSPYEKMRVIDRGASQNKEISTNLIGLPPNSLISLKCPSTDILMVMACPSTSVKLNRFEVRGICLQEQGRVPLNAHALNLIREIYNDVIGYNGCCRAEANDLDARFIQLFELKSHVDCRVLRTIKDIESEPFQTLSVSDYARICCISDGRLSKLLKNERCSSITVTRLWARAMTTCISVTKGALATDAALRSGFSDYSQFSRVFKRFLGVSPCDLYSKLNMCKFTDLRSSLSFKEPNWH